MLKLDRHFFTTVATVIVGDGERKRSFTVHTSIVTARSTFFTAALAERWSTPNSNIELTEDDPDIFDLYLRCTYTNDAVSFADGPMSHTSDEKEVDRVLLLLVQMYILADKLGDCASANLVVDAFIDLLFAGGEVPAPECVRYVWDHTPCRSSLRKLMAHNWAYRAGLGDTEREMTGLLPHEFLLEVLKEKCLVQDGRKEWTVQMAFSGSFMEQKWRYHQFDDLHPKPAEVGV